MTAPAHPATAPTGLVLGGGGARAAYQVGVLQALVDIRHRLGGPARRSPFDVICGTSAGAINACALACHNDDLSRGVGNLADVWGNFRAEQVYRADAFGVVRSSMRWLSMLSLGWAIARWRRNKPRSLLDNSPLDALLEQMIPLGRIPMLMADGQLRGLAVSASSYSSGAHMTFYESTGDVAPWERYQRTAIRGPISRAHMLASSAIPFVFPAVPIELPSGRQWFGDGSMRQTSPISPAIHLGAKRVLVIGVGQMQGGERRTAVNPGYPSLGQIAGHALSNIFLDALTVDIERLQRVNRTLAVLDGVGGACAELTPIDVLVIAPSQRLDDIAARHVDALPIAVRTLLTGIGACGPQGAGHDAGGALASYLLFEAAYTQELMALGRADTLTRQAEVARFFGWTRAHAATTANRTVGASEDAGSTAMHAL